MTRSSYRAWCGVIGRVLPKPAALMREALSEMLPVRITTGEIRAYLPVSSDEGMAAGSGTSLSYVHTCAGRLRRGGGRILKFPLRYRGYVHTYAERTRADLPFLEDNDGLERAVSKQTRQIGCWTHFLRSGFWPRSATAPRPRMCERM